MPGPSSTVTPPVPDASWREAVANLARKAGLALRIVQVRLRFIAVLVVAFLVVGKWDTLRSQFDRLTRDRGPVDPAHAMSVDTEYFCPMCPGVLSDWPSKCPVCNMALVRRKKGNMAPLPDGVVARMQFSPYRLQLAGIATAPVSYQPLQRTITCRGHVEIDRRRIQTVPSPVSGQVHEWCLGEPGSLLKPGERVAVVHIAGADQTDPASKPPPTNSLAALRQYLAPHGVAPVDVQPAEAGTVAVTIRTASGGYLIRNSKQRGQSVHAGDALCDLAELSQVAINASVFEADFPFLAEGVAVEVNSEALPGRTALRGHVTRRSSESGAAGRSFHVQVVVENREAALVPGMSVAVAAHVPATQLEVVAQAMAERDRVEAILCSLQTGLCAADKIGPCPSLEYLCRFLSRRLLWQQQAVLSVPETAIIDTGSRTVAYRESGPGLFDGVEVVLGPRCGGAYPVLRGLEVGDRVATAGSFLIDAETRLNPSLAASYFGAARQTIAADASASSTRGKQGEPLKNLDELSPADRLLAERQHDCPVTGQPLGSMGTPVKIDSNGRSVFLCCEGCEASFRRNPAKYLPKLTGD